MDLLHDSPHKLYFRYLVPSISATMVTSIYLLADSIMVGKGIGELAIAALNLVLPLFNILFGTGALFGVGGGVLFSVAMGNLDPDRAKRYFTLAFFLTSAFAICYFIGYNLFLEPLLYALGATDLTFHYAYDYAKWIALGAPIFCFSYFLQSFVRNDKNPRLAMIAVISGGITNIILDWIFIYPMQLGMAGAAIATDIGSSITCLILCTHFFRSSCHLQLTRQQLRPRFIKEIFQYGVSSFFSEISSGIVIFVFNQQLLLYAGELGVTVYSILSNSSYIVLACSNGIAQAAQPLLATNFGAKSTARIQAIQTIGLRTAFTEGCLFASIGLLFPLTVVYLFIHPTEAILEMAPTAVRIYFLSFIGASLNIFFTTYFQATLQPSRAITICALRGLVLCVSFAYILPLLLHNVTGIWLAILLAESITLLIAFTLDKINKHNRNNYNILA